jgi:hypothetical protein
MTGLAVQAQLHRPNVTLQPSIERDPRGRENAFQVTELDLCYLVPYDGWWRRNLFS